MGKFTDFYRIVSPAQPSVTVNDNQIMDHGYASTSNFNWYQKIIQGSSSRVSRYNEYNIMDQDVEIARALDIVAEEMTPRNNKNNMPLEIDLQIEEGHESDDTLVLTIRAALRHWCSLHGFDNNRLFKLSRNMVKYGDCFFRKTSNYKQWEWIPASDIAGAVVDANDVTRILGYQVRTNSKTPNAPNMATSSYRSISSKDEYEIIDADKMVVFSINDDMSDSAPFGESILRTVYKTHKQKELLEDAIIIYRIQRAPERRVFYIDVGKMPPNRIKTYLETIKNEMRQKRIPSQSPNGTNAVDAVYNPQCLALDTLIPLMDGRTLSLSDIIAEIDNGNELWAYSVDPETNTCHPGIISWAGVTRVNTNVIKVTLSNGNEIICTPDHNVPVRGRGFVPAILLTPDDELFETCTTETDLTTAHAQFERYNHWDEYTKDLTPGTISIVNIETVTELMDVGTLTIDQLDYYHAHHTFATACGLFVKNSQMEDIFLAQRADGAGSKVDVLQGGCLDLDTKIDLIDNESKTLRDLITDYENGIENITISCCPCSGKLLPGKISWAGITHESTGVVELVLDNNNKIICTPDHRFPVWGKGFIQASDLADNDIIIGYTSTDTTVYYHPEKRYIKSKYLIELQKHHISASQFYNGTVHKLIQIITNAYQNTGSVNLIPAWIHNNDAATFTTLCANLLHESPDDINDDTLQLVVQNIGYSNLNHLVSDIPRYGHKVVSYTVLDEFRTVGTLTIDQEEKDHDFHTFSLSCGVFTKNSQLGEQNDLDYFADKVLRGLRVPIAWMKPGTNNAIFNDGKVGAAYIEEQQFAKFVERLQTYVAGTLDEEFKTYLFQSNIHVDNSLFKIKLPPPSNYQKYQQAEMDSALLNTISSADGLQYLSKRFILSRYLQLSEDEILTNEQLIKQEKGLVLNTDKNLTSVYGVPSEGGMGMGGGMDMGMGGGMDMGGADIGGAGDDIINMGGAGAGDAGALPPTGGALPPTQ
jgi:hypothetical protein